MCRMDSSAWWELLAFPPSGDVLADLAALEGHWMDLAEAEHQVAVWEPGQQLSEPDVSDPLSAALSHPRDVQEEACAEGVRFLRAVALAKGLRPAG